MGKIVSLIRNAQPEKYGIKKRKGVFVIKATMVPNAKNVPMEQIPPLTEVRVFVMPLTNTTICMPINAKADAKTTNNG